VRLARARIWGKGQMTIPAGPRHAAGQEVKGEGTVVVTRIPNA
jgi:hypothetical protein